MNENELILATSQVSQRIFCDRRRTGRIKFYERTSPMHVRQNADVEIRRAEFEVINSRNLVIFTICVPSA